MFPHREDILTDKTRFSCAVHALPMDLTTVLSLGQGIAIKLTSGDTRRLAFFDRNTYVFVNKSSK